MAGIFRAAWSCCSSSVQGKLVMVAWPPTTGPATPKLARSIEKCSCARNSCTIVSRLGNCELGKVFSTSGTRQPFSGEKTARLVLVPPISPASSITMFSFDRYNGCLLAEYIMLSIDIQKGIPNVYTRDDCKNCPTPESGYYEADQLMLLKNYYRFSLLLCFLMFFLASCNLIPH